MFLSADAQALLAAEAFVEDAAVRATGCRHLRVDTAPFILVPLGLAGEDGAPLAFGWGRGEEMGLCVVPEPRDRDEVWAGLTEMARVLCRWIDPIGEARIAVGEKRKRWVTRESAQLVVPTGAGADLLRKLAARMVWAPEEVDPVVRRAGGCLLFFLDRHELALWESALLIVTEALAMHWTLPLSGAEGSHLLASLAALERPGRAREAAQEVEHEPGGALTMPDFDAKKLEPAIAAYGGAASSEGRAARRRDVEDLLRPIVRRLYEACVSGLERLRAIPPIPAVLEERHEDEREALARHASYLREEGRFSKADSLRRSVFLLDGVEGEMKRVRSSARRQDPVLRAVAMCEGAALEGEVLRSDWVRQRPRIFRAELVVRVSGAWRASVERFQVVWEREKPAHVAVIGVEADGEHTLVHLRSADQHKQLREELDGLLAPGRPIALVQEERSFQTFGFPPEVPWMLRGSDA